MKLDRLGKGNEEWLICLQIRVIGVGNGTKIESFGVVRKQLPSFIKDSSQDEIGAWGPRLNTDNRVVPGSDFFEQLQGSLVQLRTLASH